MLLLDMSVLRSFNGFTYAFNASNFSQIKLTASASIFLQYCRTVDAPDMGVQCFVFDKPQHSIGSDGCLAFTFRHAAR